jgi:hypothetical protein
MGVALLSGIATAREATMNLNEYTLKVTEEQLRFIARAFEKKAQSHFNGNPKNFSLHIEKARPF